ncbi:MAG: sodium:alanine symporter family protein [Oscillospiraceae bacterium]|nr:sodium:alanine symporter family protein [Oscillospiraceae bacterium]
MGNLISSINNTLWGVPMLILLVGCGVYLTVRLKFLQIFKARLWISETLGSIFTKKEKSESGISPYQALSSALASTIGSGNLIGAATAIASGGPGAVFWMWIAAFFGMATKYTEVFLAVHFRKKNGEGYYGGPMYYIERGLGREYRWLAVVFAVSGALACIGMGGMNQANSIATLLNSRVEFPPFVIGVILSLVAWKGISGGIGKLTRRVEKIVPVMVLLFVGMCVFIMFSDVKRTASAFAMIFKAAISPRAVYGAASGEMMRRAMRFGIARGVFSNEAGLGSSPIVHAAADAKSPEKQGFWGILEVFVDTIIMCTLTALIIVSSGESGKNLTGADLVTAAFAEHTGTFGELFVGGSVILFAITTILGWSYYGESCVFYLSGERAISRKIYRVVYALGVGIGATMSVDGVWELSDMFNGMMMAPNLIAVILLSDIVIKKSG